MSLCNLSYIYITNYRNLLYICRNMMRHLRIRNDKEIGFVDPNVIFKDQKTPYVFGELKRREIYGGS